MSDNVIQKVIEIGQMNFRGTLIDDGWYNHITFDNGKPNLNAILILSEIIYWYKPSEVKDEITGQLKGFKKKFYNDKLQKNYQSLADRFGISKRQAQDACNFLKNQNLIAIEHRSVPGKDGRLIPNVTFIEPIPENVKKISCLYEEKYKLLEQAKNKDNVTYITLESDIPHVETCDTTHSNVTYGTSERDTNTCTTTKSTTKNTNQSIYQRDKMDENEPKDYRDIILQNIEYELLKEDYPNESLVDDITEIIIDTVNSKKKTIKISGEDKPADIVKSIFLKLNKCHIEFVIEGLNNNRVKIMNIKNYMITTLYNAPNTMNMYYTNRVNVD